MKLTQQQISFIIFNKREYYLANDICKKFRITNPSMITSRYLDDDDYKIIDHKTYWTIEAVIKIFLKVSFTGKLEFIEQIIKSKSVKNYISVLFNN